MRRLAVRASGSDAVALMQASCARTQTLRLRHGASDWETASGGLGSSWKGGPGFVRATADATKRVLPDFRLSTFLAFPCRRAAFPICQGAATAARQGWRRMKLASVRRQTHRRMRMRISGSFQSSAR